MGVELRRSAAAYPEGAVGDADASPGDGHGVLEGGGGRVGAPVQAVPFAAHLHLHRKPVCVLETRSEDAIHISSTSTSD